MAQHDTSLSTPRATQAISRRAFNALTFGLVTVSFLIMWGMYLYASGPAMLRLAQSGILMPVFIASVVADFAGIILMNIGKSKESLPLSIVGYTLFTFALGFSLAIGLTAYDVGTITYAFGITACLSGIFLVAGVTFPEFFSRIGRILFISLIALIVVEFVAIVFFHANQTIFDYLVIALFCGYLGYDSYLMASDTPTVPNAIWHASNIYLDVVNILVRVLRILDRD